MTTCRDPRHGVGWDVRGKRKPCVRCEHRDLLVARELGFTQGREDRRAGVRSTHTLGAMTLPKAWHESYVKGYEAGWQA